MAHSCTCCGDPAATLTDDGELLCDDCDTTSQPRIDRHDAAPKAVTAGEL